MKTEFIVVLVITIAIFDLAVAQYNYPGTTFMHI